MIRAFSGRRLETPKSGQSRTVDMSQELARALPRLQVERKAGLPLHFTPHSLRHTFASLLLQMGVSPVYVQRQLGHAPIQLTVDFYGRWLPMGNKAILDRLDGASGSKMVAASPLGGSVGSEAPDFPMGSRELGQIAHATSS